MATGNVTKNGMNEEPSGVTAKKLVKHTNWGGDYTEFSFVLNVDTFSNQIKATDLRQLGANLTTYGSKLLYVPIGGLSFVTDVFDPTSSSINISEIHIAVNGGKLIKLHFSSYDDTPSRTFNKYLKLYTGKKYTIKLSVNDRDGTVGSFEIFKDGVKMTSKVTETNPGKGGDADTSIEVGDSAISMNLERGGRRRSKRATQRRRRNRRSTRKH